MREDSGIILRGLAAGEGVEPSSSGSKPDVLPVTPSRKEIADCQLPIGLLKHKKRSSTGVRDRQLAIGNRQ
jgi:hypothetical protein